MEVARRSFGVLSLLKRNLFEASQVEKMNRNTKLHYIYYFCTKLNEF